MMLRNTEADFLAHFEAAVVRAKKELRGFVRILVRQNDAAMVPGARRRWCATTKKKSSDTVENTLIIW